MSKLVEIAPSCSKFGGTQVKYLLSFSTLLFVSGNLFASEVNYNHCAQTMNSFKDTMNNFAEIGPQGDLKIKRHTKSMEITGNKVIYKIFDVDDKADKFNFSLSKTKSTKVVNNEEFVVEYEKVEDGKPLGKIKNISYEMKDLKFDPAGLNPGAVSVAFDYKNGHCVPNVKKLDHFAGAGLAVKTMMKIADSKYSLMTGAKDLYKCKALEDYRSVLEELKTCMSAKDRIVELDKLVTELEADEGEKGKKFDEQKSKKEFLSAFDVVGRAYNAQTACAVSGYKDVLVDEKFWQDIRKQDSGDKKLDSTEASINR